MLGPILFLLYTADLMSIVKRHKLLPHAYADDVQIYGSCNYVNNVKTHDKPTHDDKHNTKHDGS